MNAPTPEALSLVVDRIILIGEGSSQAFSDPEQAHSEEDALLRQIIEAFSPEWVIAEVRRLAEADFPRWFA